MTDEEYKDLHKKIIEEQKAICQKYNVEWTPSSPDMKIGISKNIKSSTMPINGLRHPVEKETAGWYIWAGDFSDKDDFFDPVHVEHLSDDLPIVLKYLGLPPGWRFQIDDKGHEDVWFDEKLLGYWGQPLFMIY
ncbi:MAG: hypothetical protein WDN09_02130 [bacterium]